MTPDAKEFLLAEYAHLRAEILDALRQVPANEKWALTISGVFWAWFALSQSKLPHPLIVVWFPAVLVAVLCLRWRAIEDKFTTFNEYVRQVEERFELDGLGWEHHINDAGRHWFRKSERLTWGALVLGNVALALWAVCTHS